MTYSPYLISNYQTGLDTDQAAWLLPVDAFTEINNGFLKHGRIIKRNGFQLLGTLGLTQVTGIYNFVTNTGIEEVIATDTTSTYRFNSGTQSFDLLDSPWTSSNYQWFANFGVTGVTTQNKLYITNFFDRIRSYVTGAGATTVFEPNFGTLATDIVTRALMIFVIKGRLLLLNTFEQTGVVPAISQYPQRARWSQVRNPDVWDQNTPGKGGFVDAPTGDFIVGARYLQDYIIVFFTNSVWSLKPTADPALPFRWDKVNNYRACDATFGTISHDRYVISLGKTGIVACDGIEVKRIDDKIQNFTSDVVNNDLFSQIFSDRNYTERRSWTLYNEDDEEITTENNRALVRNEEDGSWSKFKVNLSCLGQGNTTIDFAFSDFVGPAYDYAWDDFEDSETFQSYYISGETQILLGGDYEGNVYILDNGSDDNGSGFTFSLESAGWNPFKDQGIQAQLGWIDIYADVDPKAQIIVSFFSDDLTAPYSQQNVNLVPEQGFLSTIQNVALTNPCQVIADSHGLLTGQEIFISGVLGTLGVNREGIPYTITVVNENLITLDGIDATAFAAYIEGGIITEYDPGQFSKVWVRAYGGGIGYLHHIKLETSSRKQNIEIDSITPWFRQVGSRMLT